MGRDGSHEPCARVSEQKARFMSPFMTEIEYVVTPLNEVTNLIEGSLLKAGFLGVISLVVSLRL